jgi:hypothetical protein
MALATSLPTRMGLSTGTVYYCGRVNGLDSRTPAQAQSSATPFKTIPGAITALQNAGLLSNAILQLIPDGVYTESWNFSGIRPALPFTITSQYTTQMGDLTTRAIVTPSGSGTQALKLTNCTNVRFSYLEIDGKGQWGSFTLIGPTGGASDAAINVSTATGAIEIDHCWIHDTVDTGIYLGGNTGTQDVNDLHVTNCFLQACGRAMFYTSSNQQYYWPGHTHGVYAAHCFRLYIANTVVSDVPAGNGLQLYPECNNALVTGTTIVGCMRAGIIIGGDGGTYNTQTGPRPSSNNQIRNSVISNLPSALTSGSPPPFPASSGAASTFTTQNPGNFGYGAGVDYFWGGAVGTGNIVDRVNFYKTKTTVSAGGGITVTNTYSGTPGYRNSYDGTLEDGGGAIYNAASVFFAAAGGTSGVWNGPNHAPRDVSVLSSSPLAGKALDSYLPLVDQAGTARTGLTLGAFESGGSGGGGGGGGSGGFQTPTAVQAVINYAGSANETSHTWTTGVAVAQGHHLIFTIGINVQNASVSSITDSKGNTYTVDKVQPASAGANGQTIVIASGYIATALTATDTVTANFTSATITCYADEWSGLAATSYVDQTAGQEQAATAAPSSGATATTTQATELVIGATIYSGSHSPTTVGTGYTARKLDLVPTGTFIRTQSSEYQVVTATGAQTATFGISGTSNTDTAVVTYKAAAASGGGTVAAGYVQETATYQNTTTTSETSHAIPVAKATTVGNTVVVTVVCSGAVTVTVTDSKGNTYTVDRSQQFSTTETVAIAHGYQTAALTTSDTITVTVSASQWMTVACEEFVGMLSASPADVGASATVGASPDAAPTSGASATTAQASEIVIGVIGTTGGPTLTVASGWTTFPVGQLNPQGASFARQHLPAYQIATATGTFTMSASASTTTNWAAAVQTYKAVTAVGPTVTAAPTVSWSGQLARGVTVTTTNGTWTGTPTSYTYQWQRDNSGDGSYSNITGATASTYTLVEADVGCTLRCLVTATNAAGSATAPSSSTTEAEETGSTRLLSGLGV